MLVIYNKPKVTLLAVQEFTNPLEGWDTDAPSGGEALAEFAGRLCYLSFGEDVDLGAHKTVRGRQGNLPYLQNILKQKHGSVCEHATFSFLIEQVSRSLTHELVRHRAGLAYSQLSQRYVDESQVAFVRPPEIKAGTPANELFETGCQLALYHYRTLLEQVTGDVGDSGTPTERKKRARQTARALLPNCAETKIVVTGNARALRHLLEMRGSTGADREIRALAVEMAHHLKSASPNIFADVCVVEAPDGLPMVEVGHSKV